MEEIIYTCESCQKDITYRTNAEDYRLHLMSGIKKQAHHHTPTPHTDDRVLDPLPKAAHFCDFECLKDWLDAP